MCLHMNFKKIQVMVNKYNQNKDFDIKIKNGKNQQQYTYGQTPFQQTIQWNKIPHL